MASVKTEGNAPAVVSSNGSSASSAVKNDPTPLSSEEAQKVLLSPDGYYSYLNIPAPNPAPAHLPSSFSTKKDAEPTIDLDRVKRNYRRLSLRHHPDRRGGDPEAFRLLNRAKVVLSSPKLRREYDLVGLDLDDDAEEHEHEEAERSSGEGSNGDADSDNATSDEGKEGGGSTADTVMSHLASATLATILQVAVRTAMMAAVAVIISRHKILAFITIGSMCFLSFRIYGTMKKVPGSVEMRDVISPIVIAVGIMLMNWGRGDDFPWSWAFWLGETTVMTMFMANSLPEKKALIVAGLAVLSMFISLILRGKFWRYMGVLGFEAALALLAVVVFPIMEMILEEIIQEKMRKVGEKIRAHAKRADASSS